MKGQAISGAHRSRREFHGFAVSQSQYRAGASLPKHFHERAVLSFGLRGGTTVRLARSTEWCDEGHLLFLAPGDTHANRYPRSAARLHIEVTPEFWASAAGTREACRASGAVQHPISLDLRRAALTGLSSDGDLAGLALALNLTDMIGVLSGARRDRPKATDRDRWLLDLRDFLDAHCVESLDLRRLAAVARRHPAHISRAFGQHFGKSITQFVRERRLLRAATLLQSGREPLAQIALRCGFCDQSHLTNVFRRYAGTTPARMRQRMRIDAPVTDRRRPADRESHENQETISLFRL